MPRRRTPPPPDDRNHWIDRLECELSDARRTIVGLVPEPLHALLAARRHCDTTEDWLAWRRWAMEKLIAHASVAERGVEWNGIRIPPRARCPLCGGSRDPSVAGATHAMPIGLRRHLDGSHRVRQCPVFEAADLPALRTVVRKGIDAEEGRPWPTIDRGRPPWVEPPKSKAEVIALRPREAT